MAIGFSPFVKGILVLIVVLVAFAIFVPPVKSAAQGVFDVVNNILEALGLKEPSIKIIEFSAESLTVEASDIMAGLKWEISNKKYIFDHREDNFKLRFSVASNYYASLEPDNYKVVDEIKLPSNLDTADYKIGVGLVRFRLEIVREKGEEKVFDSRTVDVGVYNDEYVDLYDRPLDGADSATNKRKRDIERFIADPKQLALIEPVISGVGPECGIDNNKLKPSCTPSQIKTIFEAYINVLMKRDIETFILTPGELELIKPVVSGFGHDSQCSIVKEKLVSCEASEIKTIFEAYLDIAIESFKESIKDKTASEQSRLIERERLSLSHPSSDYSKNIRDVLIRRGWYNCDVKENMCIKERASDLIISVKDAKWEPSEGDLTKDLAAVFTLDTNNPLDAKGYIELWEDWNDVAGGCDSLYNNNTEEAKIPFDLKVEKGEHKITVKLDASKERKITDISKYQYAGELVCKDNKEKNYCNEDCNSKTFSDYFYKVFIDEGEEKSRSDGDVKINGVIHGKLENVGNYLWVRNPDGTAHVTFKAKVKDKPLTGYGYIEIWEDWNDGVWPWEQDKCNSLLNGNGKEARTLLNFENYDGDEIIKETNKIKLEKVTDKTTYSYPDREDCKDNTFSGYVYRIYFNREGYSAKLEVKA